MELLARTYGQMRIKLLLYFYLLLFIIAVILLFPFFLHLRNIVVSRFDQVAEYLEE